MEKIERVNGTRFWLDDEAMYEGKKSRVVGVSWDADAQMPIYDIEVPARNGNRGGLQFYRLVQAFEKELEPAI